MKNMLIDGASQGVSLFVIGISNPSYPLPALEETCGDGPEDEAADMSRVCHSAGRLLETAPRLGTALESIPRSAAQPGHR